MLYHKMPLNSNYPFADASVAAAASAASPSAKLSFNINAFNGNTTNFNRCSRPSAKAVLSIPAPLKFHVLPNVDKKVPRVGVMKPLTL